MKVKDSIELYCWSYRICRGRNIADKNKNKNKTTNKSVKNLGIQEAGGLSIYYYYYLVTRVLGLLLLCLWSQPVVPFFVNCLLDLTFGLAGWHHWVLLVVSSSSLLDSRILHFFVRWKPAWMNDWLFIPALTKICLSRGKYGCEKIGTSTLPSSLKP